MPTKGHKKSVPESVKRIILLRSHGFCEYTRCPKTALGLNPTTGAWKQDGEFCHILPVGDSGAPRSSFKELRDYSDEFLNSEKNLILLCRNHHRKIDALEVDRHSPDLLYHMVFRNSEIIESALEELKGSSEYPSHPSNWYDDIRISAVYSHLLRAGRLGPRTGLREIKSARRALNYIAKNPHIEFDKESMLCVRLHILLAELKLTYSKERWETGFNEFLGLMKRFRSLKSLRFVLPAAMFFIRDDYNLFYNIQKENLAKECISKIDDFLKDESISPTSQAQYLAQKAGMLRWRGRFNVGKVQRNLYDAAERCALKSVGLAPHPATALQLVLIKSSRFLSMYAGKRDDADRRKQVERWRDELFTSIRDKQLDSYPPALKYRPRLFRDIYLFDEAISSFQEAVSHGFKSDLYGQAYLLGESAMLRRYYRETADLEPVEDADEYLRQALDGGYDHGRNMLAWMACRAVLDESWFRQIVMEVLSGDVGEVEWETLALRFGEHVHGGEISGKHLLFGIDQVEYWNTLGTTTFHVLGDHRSALRFYEIAAHLAPSSKGNFRSKVGMTRALTAAGDLDEASKWLTSAWGQARAYQVEFLEGLSEEIIACHEGKSSENGRLSPD